jgi:hypothetical protein
VAKLPLARRGDELPGSGDDVIVDMRFKSPRELDSLVLDDQDIFDVTERIDRDKLPPFRIQLKLRRLAKLWHRRLALPFRFVVWGQSAPISTGRPASRHSGKPSSRRRARKPRSRRSVTASGEKTQ